MTIPKAETYLALERDLHDRDQVRVYQVRPSPGRRDYLLVFACHIDALDCLLSGISRIISEADDADFPMRITLALDVFINGNQQC